MNIFKKRFAGLSVLLLTSALTLVQVAAVKAADTGSVTGKVFISVDGAASTPLANVPVTLADSNYVNYGVGSPTGTSNSSQTGEYSFSNLADGTYYAFVGALNTDKLSNDSPLTQADSGNWYASLAYYSSSGLGYLSASLYSRITISGGSVSTATDITLPGWASVGQISGSLLDSNGQPLDVDNGLGISDPSDSSDVKEGVYVSLTNGYPIHHQYADLTGHFSFYLPEGTYLISYGDPEWGNPIFENGAISAVYAPHLDLAAGAVSAGHNFVIKRFDLTEVGASKAKFIGQLKPGTDMKVTGLKFPSGATVEYSWSCAVESAGQGSYLGQGPVLHVAVDAPLSCPSGKLQLTITLSKSSYIDVTFTVQRTVKVVSTAKLKYDASSTKLINKFTSISGTNTLGSTVRGENGTFKLKSVSKTATSWFRCPTQAAAQTPRLVGCQQIVSANNKRTYKISAYDARAFLVYRVKVKKYSDPRHHGTIAPADSLPLAVGYF